MIDICTERLYSLREAAQFCPPRRNGKRPDASCLYRWASNGLFGVRLQVLKVGGTTCTSAEALQRFFNELTRVSGLDDERAVAAAPEPTAAVERQLDEFGL